MDAQNPRVRVQAMRQLGRHGSRRDGELDDAARPLPPEGHDEVLLLSGLERQAGDDLTFGTGEDSLRLGEEARIAAQVHAKEVAVAAIVARVGDLGARPCVPVEPGHPRRRAQRAIELPESDLVRLVASEDAPGRGEAVIREQVPWLHGTAVRVT